MGKVKEKGSGLFLFGVMAGYTFIYMDKNMISFSTNTISDAFGYTSGQMGLVMGIFFLSYSLCQPIGGQLVDRIGAKKMLIFSMVGSALCSFLFGAVSSVFFLCLARFFTGASHASYPSGSTRAIADNFSLEKRSFAQSIIMTTSSIGGILAFVVGARIIEINWRYAYIFIGALYLIAALLLVFCVPNEEVAVGEKKKKSPLKIRKIISNKKILLFCITELIYNFVAYGALSWIPKYLQQERGMSVAASGTLLAIVAVACTIGAMLTGLLLRKALVGKEKVFTAVCVFVTGAALLVFMQVTNIVLAGVLLVIINTLLVSTLASLVSWPHRIISPDHIGSSVGVINGIATMGGFFSPIILGFVLDATNNSFSTVFIILAAAALVCGVGILTLSEKKIEFDLD